MFEQLWSVLTICVVFSKLFLYYTWVADKNDKLIAKSKNPIFWKQIIIFFWFKSVKLTKLIFKHPSFSKKFKSQFSLKSEYEQSKFNIQVTESHKNQNVTKYI